MKQMTNGEDGRDSGGSLMCRELPARKNTSRDNGAVSDVERALIGIWREVLGVDQVYRHASFFDLGGHSLLATQVIARIERVFGVELPLRRLFEIPTVAELSAELTDLVALGNARRKEIELALARMNGLSSENRAILLRSMKQAPPTGSSHEG